MQTWFPVNVPVCLRHLLCGSIHCLHYPRLNGASEAQTLTGVVCVEARSSQPAAAQPQNFGGATGQFASTAASPNRAASKASAASGSKSAPLAAEKAAAKREISGQSNRLHLPVNMRFGPLFGNWNRHLPKEFIYSSKLHCADRRCVYRSKVITAGRSTIAEAASFCCSSCSTSCPEGIWAIAGFAEPVSLGSAGRSIKIISPCEAKHPCC